MAVFFHAPGRSRQVSLVVYSRIVNVFLTFETTAANLLLFLPFSLQGRDKDLQPDEDQNGAAQNGRLAGEAGAELPPDDQPRGADDKGDRRDDRRADRRHQRPVLGDGKADRQRVDGGSHPLQKQATAADGFRLPAVLVADALQQHLAADVGQQTQRDPGDQDGKALEQLHHRVDADPSQQGHQGLKPGEHPCHPKHPFPAHARLIEAVGHRHRKGVHSQAHPQQQTIDEKTQTPFHGSSSQHKIKTGAARRLCPEVRFG